MENKKIKVNTKDVALMGLFVALIIVGGFIKIPTPLVPVTLQVEVALLAGLLLGGVKGGICMVIYMVMGLIGIPVFTAGGGFSYVLYPTFGYIIGFAVCAFFVGFLVNYLKKHNYLESKLKYLWVFLVTLGGLLIVYVIGVVYMFLIKNFYLQTEMTFAKALYYGFVLFLPFDLLGCVVSTIAYIKLAPIINREKQGKEKEQILNSEDSAQQ